MRISLPTATRHLKPTPRQLLSRGTQQPLSTLPTHSLRTTTTTTTQPSSCTTTTATLTPQPRSSNPTNQQQRRTFLSSFLPGSGSNGSDNDSSSRTRRLTATRTLPYSPAPLFEVISDVQSYSSFLPFLTASTVTHRDPATRYPTRAFLTVGYGPLSETFTSKVDCDPQRLTVTAQSGARFGVAKKDGQDVSSGGSGSGFGFPGAEEGIFEYLSTKWELADVTAEIGGGKSMTRVHLEIGFEFKNQWHATMMSAVEGQMAGVMIEAFEKRMGEVVGR
ncbi:hypothetical protein BO86DRAFT_385757 [Aspergillus japonicus CBS 114.51]|uniref:Coenzyme Q-binding protein COQ10 START domain-containing protein n=2 Tax=Aspergillus TaxID=5052 RepID=A0A2V5I3B9_ASPV1|nr:hypothetical protein BO86DRAFT_385757 [Aspergillus japonicus CBS 114.51]PYI14116.1 hypothetical protein BO99DRAFT_406931 [Aspergillus violaceofuscus CBS 115571]RAH86290.1 hypothetical protein BO86DRAFT_385757 [Aspergillus japonicus CBS 114.51]